MKVIASFIIGITLAAYTAYNIHEGAKPWAPKIIGMCFNPANKEVEGNLRVAYTGASSILDRIICFYVSFTQQPLHDIVGVHVMRLLMGSFATAYAIMCFEGSRKGYKKSTLLAAFPLLGLLSNLIGISLVFPALWVPLYLHYQKSKSTDKEGLSMTLPEVYGILLSIVVGYGVPSAILSSPLVPNDSRLEQELLSIWQVLPIIIVPLFGVCENMFKKIGSPVDAVAQPALKKRLYIAEGKDALERSYLFLGILNMFLYFGSYLMLSLQGIRIWDSMIMLLSAPNNLPAGLTFGDLGQLLGTRIVLVEYISLSLSFVLYAIFNSGIIAGLAVAFMTPVVGSAAAIAFYSYYREGVIQDISDTEQVDATKRN